MNHLSNLELIHTYERAIELGLADRFIRLIEDEIAIREFTLQELRYLKVVYDGQKGRRLIKAHYEDVAY